MPQETRTPTAMHRIHKTFQERLESQFGRDLRWWLARVFGSSLLSVARRESPRRARPVEYNPVEILQGGPEVRAVPVYFGMWRRIMSRLMDLR
jgi:hypothetical protein